MKKEASEKASQMSASEIVGTSCALLDQARSNAQLAVNLLAYTKVDAAGTGTENVVEGEARKQTEELLKKSLAILIGATDIVTAKG